MALKYDYKTNPLVEMKAFKAAFEDACAHPDWRTARLIERQRWNPYSMEGGLVFIYNVVIILFVQFYLCSVW